ncbi:ERI1 exoribonuclease 2-like [Acanthaster planci]|uniref:ERI1 exoribonuclease 2 n=1 Tax=Acanthaster planci TaxID=133434 RepID=A0A8B7XY88_ACAPL|nr:ERI1 exoribonuclease 2-like [Acanthaster planci]XP_022084741.1 ERI1 exoribonuclease 2-like [Acanthaster planci]
MKSTKELARQLGLLRRHSTSLNQQSRDVRRVGKTNQIFSYLIVIDFESTCWKDKRNVGQEVIEFPAVLLNTSTGSIESEFHTYVLPEENPQLSAFCTELTGITQDQVESGVPLRVCLSKFSRWLTKQESEKNIAYNTGDDGKKLCTFVTWSDWDLSVCLHYECRRKQLLKPPALNSWIDLRATYKNFYKRKPNGLHGALQDVGIEFHGRQHSGIDDARNTAQLAWRMMCDGCVMSVTRTMPGAQPPKRKQTTQPSDQPTKIQVKPSANKEKQRPDSLCLNTHRHAEPEDRLISHTQGINNDLCNTIEPLSSSIHFRIWKDDTQPANIHSIIRPKTSVPSTVRHDRGDDEIVTKSSRDVAIEVTSVQTSLGAQVQNVSKVSEKRLDRGKQTSVLRSTLDIGNNQNNHSEICGRKQVCSETSVTSSDAGLRQRIVTDAMNKISKEVVSSSENTGSAVQNSRNHLKLVDSAKTSPQSENLSRSHLPGPSSRKSVHYQAPVILKTPSNTPVHRRPREPSPMNGFRTPYAPGSHHTPGSSTFRTPTYSSKKLSTPPLIGGKITPPMCQCGRRAKRCTVQSPGPNMNRAFYSCTSRRKSSEAGLRDVTNAGKGCGYFKWESVVLAEKQQSFITTPVKQESCWSAQKQPGVPLDPAATVERKCPTPSCSSAKIVTPITGFSGKRLGTAMRAVWRHQTK